MKIQIQHVGISFKRIASGSGVGIGVGIALTIDIGTMILINILISSKIRISIRIGIRSSAGKIITITIIAVMGIFMLSSAAGPTLRAFQCRTGPGPGATGRTRIQLPGVDVEGIGTRFGASFGRFLVIFTTTGSAVAPSAGGCYC